MRILPWSGQQNDLYVPFMMSLICKDSEVEISRFLPLFFLKIKFGIERGDSVVLQQTRPDLITILKLSSLQHRRLSAVLLDTILDTNYVKFQESLKIFNKQFNFNFFSFNTIYIKKV